MVDLEELRRAMNHTNTATAAQRRARQPQLPSPTSRITRISMGRMNWK